MKPIQSPVFGKMKFIYGWVKPAKMTVGETVYDILIEAESSQGQDILPIQEERYQEYVRCEESFSKELENALTSSAVADGKFKPTTLRFERSGGVCVVIESTLDHTIKGLYRFNPVHRFEKLGQI